MSEDETRVIPAVEPDETVTMPRTIAPADELTAIGPRPVDETAVIPAVQGPSEDDFNELRRVAEATMRMAAASATMIMEGHGFTTGPRGFFGALVQVAMDNADESNRLRLNVITGILADNPGLRDELVGRPEPGQLRTSRMAYAAHVLTGPALLTIRSGGDPAGSVSGTMAESMLSWRSFVVNPALRLAAVHELSGSPVTALLRMTYRDVMMAILSRRYDRAAGSLISAASQVGRWDATCSNMIVDMAVACLLPPGRVPEVHDFGPGMKTLRW